MNLSQLNFDELILPPQYIHIHHSPDYIKSGTGDTAKRRIFYEVPLDDFERQQILKFYELLQSKRIKLPHQWTERDSLKYIYSSKFDHEKATEKIKGCLEWRSNPNSQTLSPGVKFILVTKSSYHLLNFSKECGALYIHGRDKQFRPIMVLDLAKVDFDSMKEEDFNIAVTIMMDIMRDYCYVPGKIENTVVLIDLRNVSLTSVPVGAMKGFISIANACFPCTMHKSYLVGMTFMMRMSWKVVEALLSKDVVEKMQSLSDDELDKMQELIDPSQLQAKFGGNLPNLTTFWPPTSTFPHQKTPHHHHKTASFQETPRNQTPTNFEQYSYRQQNQPSPHKTASYQESPMNFESSYRQQQQPFHHKTSASFHETPRNQTPTNLENSYRQPIHSTPESFVSNRQFQSYNPERPEARYTADNSRSPVPYGNERHTSPNQRNPIFSSRSPRASQPLTGSPYREKDEALIRDIIYSKPRTSVPKTTSPPRHIQQSPQNRAINPAPIMREYEHYPHPHHNGPHHNEETVKRTGIARPLHAIKKDIMETLGDDRGQEKRMDDKIQRQFEREERPVMAKPAEKHNESWLSDNYTEADTGFNLNDMEALNMILREDRHLKGLTHNIPDEDNDAEKRNTKVNEPNQAVRRSDFSYERLSATPVKAYGNETPVHFRESSYKLKSEMKDPNETFGEGPRYHYDYDRYSLDKEVLRKSQRKEVVEERRPQEKQVEEWPTRKVRELAIYNADESDDDDDGTNFCGICVSKRGKKKNGKRV